MKRVAFAVIFILVLVVIGTGYKTLILNKPSQEPKDVVVRFMDDLKSGNSEDAQKLVSKDFDEEKKKQLQSTDSSDSSADSNSTLIYTVGDVTMHGNNKATVVVKINAVIFDLPVEVVLEKEGDWFKGFVWKIVDLNLPDFGNDETDTSDNESYSHYDIGEEFTSNEIKVEVLKVSEQKTVTSDFDTLYTAKGKFVLVELNATNLGKESISGSTSNVKLEDTEGRKFDFADKVSYMDIKNSGADYTTTLQPSDTQKLVAIFDIPKEAKPSLIIFEGLKADVNLN